MALRAPELLNRNSCNEKEDIYTIIRGISYYNKLGLNPRAISGFKISIIFFNILQISSSILPSELVYNVYYNRLVKARLPHPPSRTCHTLHSVYILPLYLSNQWIKITCS